MLKATFEDFRCKYCGSKSIVKYGVFQGMQYWWCKSCKHKFADNDALPEMKTPLNQVASALSMFYEGMSLNAIRRHLNQTHNNLPSKSSVYDWITRFTKIAVAKSEGYRPKVGSVWIADETVLKIGGKNVWFWDIIDAKTRFLLASRISRTRTTEDARRLMYEAATRAGKSPRVVLTDQLAAYLDGIELAFGADTKHIQSKPFTIENSTNLIERFHGTLKGRTKVMRGLKQIETANLFTDGYLVFYNFLRPHESLEDRTPAEAAEVSFPYKNWLDIVKSESMPVYDPSRHIPIGQTLHGYVGVSQKQPVKKQVIRRRRLSRTRANSMPTISSIRI